MAFDDDFTREPRHEGEPVEREEGVLIEGSKHADLFDDDGYELDLNPGAEPELWGEQSALIEEDEENAIRLDGFNEDDLPSILAAMGDESAEVVPDSPGGTSATGANGEPEHGGFPERAQAEDALSRDPEALEVSGAYSHEVLLGEEPEDLVLEETKPGTGIWGFEGEEVGGG